MVNAHLNDNDAPQKVNNCNFIHHLGINITSLGNGVAEASLILKDEYKQHLGVAHGGLITALADTVAGFAAISVTAPQKQVVTTELKISFLRPAKGTTLFAKGWVIKKGRSLHFCEAEVRDNGVLVAKASASMAIIQNL